MIGKTPMCFWCRHMTTQPYIDGYVCNAFSDGIPEEIIMGYDHTKPYPGDNGIRFEPIEAE